jgi:hypothetical protein
MALENCFDPAFLRAVGGPEFEELICDLRQARIERERRERRKHWPAVRRDDDRGRRDARGHAAEGRLHAAADALQLAEKRWEQARLAYLARQEEREDDPA